MSLIYNLGGRPLTRSLVSQDYLKVYIGKSNIHGKGIFASQDIDAKTRIMPYDGTALNTREFETRYHLNAPSYVMEYCFPGTSELCYIDSSTDLWALGRFINASDYPEKPRRANCKCIPDTHGQLWIHSVRPITKGEELLYPYGRDYWGDADHEGNHKRMPTDRMILDRQRYCDKKAALGFRNKLLANLQENGEQSYGELLSDASIRFYLSEACLKSQRAFFLKHQLEVLETDAHLIYDFSTQKYMTSDRFENVVLSVLHDKDWTTVDSICTKLREERRCSNVPLVSLFCERLKLSTNQLIKSPRRLRTKILQTFAEASEKLDFNMYSDSAKILVRQSIISVAQAS